MARTKNRGRVSCFSTDQINTRLIDLWACFFDLWAFFLDLSAFFWDFCAIWYLLYYKDVENIREGRVGLQMVLYVQRKIRAVVFLPLG